MFEITHIKNHTPHADIHNDALKRLCEKDFIIIENLCHRCIVLEHCTYRGNGSRMHKPTDTKKRGRLSVSEVVGDPSADKFNVHAYAQTLTLIHCGFLETSYISDTPNNC